MILTRRSFLCLFGATAAAAIVGPELVLEPRRRFWQVARNAPVGPNRVAFTEDALLSAKEWGRSVKIDDPGAGFSAEVWRELHAASGGWRENFDPDYLTAFVASNGGRIIQPRLDQVVEFDPARRALIVTAADKKRGVITLSGS